MKKQKGITLIALVITIIVLLILAGVSISMVIGENGVLNQADKATIKTRKATAEEDVELAWVSADSDYWTAWTDNSNVKRETYFDEPADLNKYLAGKGTVRSVTANADGTEYTIKYESAADENVYTIVVDSNGNAKVEGDGVHKSKVTETKETLASKITAFNYGDSITNYTAANGYSNWKIFYSNGTNVFLIASDYVNKTLVTAGMDRYSDTSYPYGVYWKSSNSAVTGTTLQSMNQLNLFRLNTENPYELNASNPNSRCVSTMLNENNWEGFKDAEGYGEYVVGGPTIEMWTASWNAKGTIYNTAEETKYESLKTENGTNGYYVGPSTTESLSEIAGNYNSLIGGFFYNVNTNSEEGYKDKLYFPHRSEVSNCYGYWLASPSANSSNGVLYVYCDGYVDRRSYNGDYYSVRPVVALSSEVLGIQNDDGSWTLKLDK